MAQTRAGAKAFRNILAWVVVLAGYKGTPAEEMQTQGPVPSGTGQGAEKSPIQSPKSKTVQPRPEQKSSETISEAQRKRFYAIAKTTGAADDQIKDWLFRKYGFEHTKDIAKDLYDEVCQRVKEEMGDMREPGQEG